MRNATVTKNKSTTAQVKKMRSSGESWRAIGEELGVSGQRVHQLWGEELASAGSPYETKRAAAVQLEKNVTAFLEEYGPVTRQELAEEFKIPMSRLSRMNIPRHLILVSQPEHKDARWTDDEIFAAMRKAEKAKGSPLTASRYLAWATEQPKGSVISLPGIHIRFDSWLEACKRAGVTPGKTRRKSYERTWSKDDCLRIANEYISACIEKGERATYVGYDREQRSHDDWPSGSTLRHITGLGWPGIVAESADY